MIEYRYSRLPTFHQCFQIPQLHVRTARIERGNHKIPLMTKDTRFEFNQSSRFGNCGFITGFCFFVLPHTSICQRQIGKDLDLEFSNTQRYRVFFTDLLKQTQRILQMALSDCSLVLIQSDRGESHITRGSATEIRMVVWHFRIQF